MRTLVCTIAGLLLARAACAQGAGESDFVNTGLDWLLLVLGVLYILAQVTERLMVLLKKLLAYRFEWAKPSAPGVRRDPEEGAERTLLLNWYSLFVGVLVAYVCGVDILDVAQHGRLESIWTSDRELDWTVFLGLFVTGLIASMGSAFIHDLISIVMALKDAKREVAAKETAPERPSYPAVHIQGEEEDVQRLVEDDAESIYDLDRVTLGLSYADLQEQAQAVRESLRNGGVEGIVAVAPNFKERRGRITRVRGLTVSVVQKVEKPSVQIPAFIEANVRGSAVLVPVDVWEVGQPGTTGSACPGSHIAGTGPGTFCCAVRDQTPPHSSYALSCLHVLGAGAFSIQDDQGAVFGGTVRRTSPDLDASVGQLTTSGAGLLNVIPPGWPLAGVLPLMDNEVTNQHPVYVWAILSGGRTVAGAMLQAQPNVPMPGVGVLRRTFCTRICLQSGDSGALAVTFRSPGQPLAVGMLSGANRDYAWFVPLWDAFAELHVQL